MVEILFKEKRTFIININPDNKSIGQSSGLKKKISSFACYYGAPNIEKLTNFSLVIIEPKLYEKEHISKLKSKGTIAIGFCAIGGVGKDEYSAIKGKPGWFMDKNNDGTPDGNADFHCYYANPASAEWQDFVIDKARAILIDKNFDGLFLDTFNIEDIYKESRQAVAALIAKLRNEFPGKYLIANRGFNIFESIAPYIAGVVFECFTSWYDFTQKQYRILKMSDIIFTHRIYKDILESFTAGGGAVLTLDYSAPGQMSIINPAWSRSIDYGFVPSVSQIELDSLNPKGGHRDAEFLGKYGRAALDKKINESAPSHKEPKRYRKKR